MKGFSKYLIPLSILIAGAFIAIGLVMFNPGLSSATATDASVIGDQFGYDDNKEADGMDIYYLDGSTAVALTIDEKREYNWDWVNIMYETASDVWRWPTADVTLKDSDSNGYIDALEFTATGGATAGGEVRIRWTSAEGGFPPI